MEHEIVVVDSAGFCCANCEEPVGLSQVILTDSFTYIFMGRCGKCDKDNQFQLVNILKSLKLNIVSHGSDRIN